MEGGAFACVGGARLGAAAVLELCLNFPQGRPLEQLELAKRPASYPVYNSYIISYPVYNSYIIR